eukprot:TRINITY_DN14689_c0_g3_i1.p1 TRINITY_DN14689_c0_g3~~TRINITY_DN14689_c0_g3_i1.p1  ORF type:complete len:271 (-),score=40.87 TRINITY_DN14689_c0_g3_i1:579-1391(-)
MMTMLPTSSRRSVHIFVVLAVLAFTRSSLADSLIEDIAALDSDNECGSEGKECTLNALQQRVRKVNTSGSTDEQNEVAYACPMVPYSGPIHGAASCFCHKAENPVCRAKPCTCREGCSEVAINQHSETVTFVNTKRVSGCRNPVSMLTIPRTYVKDFGDLQRKCPAGIKRLLVTMFINGWESHLAHTGEGGAVMQCIHKPGHVSVHWLHLHTFCPNGSVDGMPNRHTSFCGVMTGPGGAGALADKFLRWSRGEGNGSVNHYYGGHYNRYR